MWFVFHLGVRVGKGFEDADSAFRAMATMVRDLPFRAEAMNVKFMA